MEIFLSVCDKVMAPVMSRPPEWSLLIGGRSHKGHQKLENPAGLICAVCEQPMKPGRNREHAYDIQRQARDHCHRTHARPDDKQASQMHKEELNAYRAIQLFPAQRVKIFV